MENKIFHIIEIILFKEILVISTIMKTFDEWIIEANKIFNNQYEYIQIFKKDNKYNFFEIKCKIQPMAYTP